MEFAVIYLAGIQISWMGHCFGVVSIVPLLDDGVKEICKHLQVTEVRAILDLTDKCAHTKFYPQIWLHSLLHGTSVQGCKHPWTEYVH